MLLVVKLVLAGDYGNEKVLAWSSNLLYSRVPGMAVIDTWNGKILGGRKRFFGKPESEGKRWLQNENAICGRMRFWRGEQKSSQLRERGGCIGDVATRQLAKGGACSSV